MPRYRRKSKEEIAIPIAILITISLLNPTIRNSLLTAAQYALGISTIAAAIWLIYYLLKSLKENNTRNNIGINKLNGYTINERLNKNKEESIEHEIPVKRYYNTENKEKGTTNNQTNNNQLHTNKEEPSIWSLELLRSLEWRRFEIVCKELLQICGHATTETSKGADGGIDLIIHNIKEGIPQGIHAIVQCKAWNYKKIGVALVREFYGVMVHENIKNGIIMTTNDCNEYAKEFVKGKNIMMKSGDDIINIIKKLSEENQTKLLKIATEGDYKTPSCPNCYAKLRIKQNKGGNNFWACPNFPPCKHTRNLSRVDLIRLKTGFYATT